MGILQMRYFLKTLIQLNCMMFNSSFKKPPTDYDAESKKKVISTELPFCSGFCLMVHCLIVKGNREFSR